VSLLAVYFTVLAKTSGRLVAFKLCEQDRTCDVVEIYWRLGVYSFCVGTVAETVAERSYSRKVLTDTANPSELVYNVTDASISCCSLAFPIMHAQCLFQDSEIILVYLLKVPSMSCWPP